MGLHILLRLLAFVFIDTQMIIPFIQLGIFNISSSVKPQSADGTLVVLIHGSRARDWQWLVVKNYLYWRDIQSMTVRYNITQSLKKSCEDMIEQIPQNKNIVLIGHSFDGLIARA